MTDNCLKNEFKEYRISHIINYQVIVLIIGLIIHTDKVQSKHMKQSSYSFDDNGDI